MSIATGRGGRQRRPAGVWLAVLALLGGVAIAGSTGMARAQELRSGSALAGVEWPVSSYDWGDQPGGPRHRLLEQGAGDLGGHCGAVREFNAWNLADVGAPEQLPGKILDSYAAAGWSLTEPVQVEPAVYLARRGDAQLVVWLNPLPSENALALFTCGLQSVAATDAAIAAEAGRGQAAPKRLPVVGEMGLGAVALGVGLVLFGLWQRRRASAAQGWQEVPALIAASSIKTRTDTNDDDATYYTPVVHYSYRFADADHEGRRVRFGSSETSERQQAAAIIEQFKPGRTVMARVNPANPRDATLLLDAPPVGKFMVPAVIFGLLGVVLLVVAQTYGA